MRFDLECMHCGHEWHKNIEMMKSEFMHKMHNKIRKCPKCGELGLLKGLIDGLKKDIPNTLDVLQKEPRLMPKYETGDVVRWKGREGVVLDPYVHWRDPGVKGMWASVHFNDKPFRYDYDKGGNYEFVREEELELVKKKAAIVYALKRYADYFAELINSLTI